MLTIKKVHRTWLVMDDGLIACRCKTKKAAEIEKQKLEKDTYWSDLISDGINDLVLKLISKDKLLKRQDCLQRIKEEVNGKIL